MTHTYFRIQNLRLVIRASVVPLHRAPITGRPSSTIASNSASNTSVSSSPSLCLSRSSTGPFRRRMQNGRACANRLAAVGRTIAAREEEVPKRSASAAYIVERNAPLQIASKMNERAEELEYHITYPGTRPDQDRGSGAAVPGGRGDEFIFVYEEKKRPVVVLLGWAGCQDRYLAKYSAIYEERSYITLRCTVPLAYFFRRSNRLPHLGRRLLQVITEKSLHDHPIFFHVFSNGGAIFYQQISLAMQKAGSPLKIKGIIFDSSPGERKLSSVFKATNAIIGGHPLKKWPLSLMYTLMVSFFWMLEAISYLIGKCNTIVSDPMNLVKEKYSWPQIFLYSNCDSLVSASDVERFASQRAERGVRTQLVLFTDSPHVKHMSTYRDVYINTVYRFMNECLAEQTDEESSEVHEEDVVPYLTKRIVVPQKTSHQESY